MNTHVTIGLVGDYSDSVAAHRAIPPALRMASDALSIDVRHEWIPTEDVTSVARLSRFDGLWCLPGSPYRSMEGALLAIRHARETRTPFSVPALGFSTPSWNMLATSSAGATRYTAKALPHRDVSSFPSSRVP